MDGIKYDVLEFDPGANTCTCLHKNGRSASIGWPRYWYFIGAWGDYVASLGGYGGGSGNIETTPHSGMDHFNQTYVYDLTNVFDP
jgi:hypothetical protein